MYAVVGCGECNAFWVVEGRPETTTCRTCGKRHTYQRLKRFAETDDPDAAREARAALLASRSDHGEAFADVDPFADLEDDAETAGMDTKEYAAASGLDTDAIADARERAESGPGGGSSRLDTVREALRSQDRPTETAVVEHATTRGVPEDAARETLEKLVRRGEVSESGGRYRLL